MPSEAPQAPHFNPSVVSTPMKPPAAKRPRLEVAEEEEEDDIDEPIPGTSAMDVTDDDPSYVPGDSLAESPVAAAKA